MNWCTEFDRPARLRAIAIELRRISGSVDPVFRPLQLANELENLAARLEQNRE